MTTSYSIPFIITCVINFLHSKICFKMLSYSYLWSSSLLFHDNCFLVLLFFQSALLFSRISSPWPGNSPLVSGGTNVVGARSSLPIVNCVSRTRLHSRHGLVTHRVHACSLAHHAHPLTQQYPSDTVAGPFVRFAGLSSRMTS